MLVKVWRVGDCSVFSPTCDTWITPLSPMLRDHYRRGCIKSIRVIWIDNFCLLNCWFSSIFFLIIFACLICSYIFLKQNLCLRFCCIDGIWSDLAYLLGTYYLSFDIMMIMWDSNDHKDWPGVINFLTSWLFWDSLSFPSFQRKPGLVRNTFWVKS